MPSGFYCAQRLWASNTDRRKRLTVVRLTCNVGHTAVTPLGKGTRTKSASPLAAAGEHTAVVVCHVQLLNPLRGEVACSIFYFF